MLSKVIDLTGNANKTGVYVCFACNNTLFDAAKNFDAGCGFPSFWGHVDNGVKLNLLNTYNRSRIQLLCNSCGAHLDHLFTHKQTPSGLRYCINHNAVRLDLDDAKFSLATDTMNNNTIA